jgi:hypothetical protein
MTLSNHNFFGAHIKDLQRRAGQSTIQAAQIYMHGTKKRDHSVADSLNSDMTKILNHMKEKRVS